MGMSIFSDLDRIFFEASMESAQLKEVEPGSDLELQLKSLSTDFQNKYHSSKNTSDRIVLQALIYSDGSIQSINEIADYIPGLLQAQNEMREKFQEIYSTPGMYEGLLPDLDLMPHLIASIEKHEIKESDYSDNTPFDFMDSVY